MLIEKIFLLSLEFAVIAFVFVVNLHGFTFQYLTIVLHVVKCIVSNLSDESFI